MNTAIEGVGDGQPNGHMNDDPGLDAGKLQRVEEERQHLLEMSTSNAEHAASLESQLNTAEAQLSSTRQTLAESREVAERQLQASQLKYFGVNPRDLPSSSLKFLLLSAHSCLVIRLVHEMVNCRLAGFGQESCARGTSLSGEACLLA